MEEGTGRRGWGYGTVHGPSRFLRGRHSPLRSRDGALQVTGGVRGGATERSLRGRRRTDRRTGSGRTFGPGGTGVGSRGHKGTPLSVPGGVRPGEEDECYDFQTFCWTPALPLRSVPGWGWSAWDVSGVSHFLFFYLCYPVLFVLLSSER